MVNSIMIWPHYHPCLGGGGGGKYVFHCGAKIMLITFIMPSTDTWNLQLQKHRSFFFEFVE